MEKSLHIKKIIIRVYNKTQVGEDIVNKTKKLYEKIMEEKGYLIHITEYKNLKKIFKYGGILSNEILGNIDNSIEYITDNLSHELDEINNYHKYVHLAFGENYDMFSAKLHYKESKNPVIIKIKPEIIKNEEVLLSAGNSTSINIQVGSINKIYSKLNFNDIYHTTRKDRSYRSKRNRQAEVLVRNKVGLNYIENIIIPEDKENIFKTDIPIYKDDTSKILRSEKEYSPKLCKSYKVKEDKSNYKIEKEENDNKNIRNNEIKENNHVNDIRSLESIQKPKEKPKEKIKSNHSKGNKFINMIVVIIILSFLIYPFLPEKNKENKIVGKLVEVERFYSGKRLTINDGGELKQVFIDKTLIEKVGYLNLNEVYSIEGETKEYKGIKQIHPEEVEDIKKIEKEK